MKITSAILALPRRNRRALYLLAHRDDHSVTWAPYRRWDGGEPRIYAGIDLLKMKDARKKDEFKLHGILARTMGRFMDPGMAAGRRFKRQKTA
jgi:hypothetical protein